MRERVCASSCKEPFAINIKINDFVPDNINLHFVFGC